MKGNFEMKSHFKQKTPLNKQTTNSNPTTTFLIISDEQEEVFRQSIKGK